MHKKLFTSLSITVTKNIDKHIQRNRSNPKKNKRKTQISHFSPPKDRKNRTRNVKKIIRDHKYRIDELLKIL
jgi:hypothetical protein